MLWKVLITAFVIFMVANSTLCFLRANFLSATLRQSEQKGFRDQKDGMGTAFVDKSQSFTDERFTGRGAYLTLLCDDVMARAAFVLVQSLRKTQTTHDIVVLSLSASNETVSELEHLGAKVLRIKKAVKYPFKRKSHTARVINKACRYTKMLIWNMVEYDKIVYLDSDLLILKNVDDLFQRPSLSAAPDALPPDKFNSGVMVLKPNRRLYRQMMRKIATVSSPNFGDQGFLNNFFPLWNVLGPNHHLPLTDNLLVRMAGKNLLQNFDDGQVRILHFSGSTKPWNMMTDKQFPTTRKFDSLWWRVHREVEEILSRKSTLGRGILAQPSGGVDHCRENFMAYTRRSNSTEGKVSVLVNSSGHLQSLLFLVNFYSKLDFVLRIHLLLPGPISPVWREAISRASPSVDFILPRAGERPPSLLWPIESLETKALLLVDDREPLPTEALRIGLERWREQPHRLVGFFPSSLELEAGTRQKGKDSTANNVASFSMVGLEAVFLSAEYLREIPCGSGSPLKTLLSSPSSSSLSPCDEVSLNLMASFLTNEPPILITLPGHLSSHPPQGDLKVDNVAKRKCLKKMVSLLGYSPLIPSVEALTVFEGPGKVNSSRFWAIEH